MSTSTIYDVVTRYRVDDRATGANQAYSRSAVEAHRRTVGLQRSMAGLTGGLALLGRTLAPIAGALGAYAVGSKVFSNLNQEMTASIGLAAQFQQSFQFSEDPIENFTANLRASKGFMRDLIADAARLPGELSDFLAATRTTAMPVLRSGGTREQLRGMLGSLSIVAPLAGQDMGTAGRQTMRMLTGQASVGDNPLFAMLSGSGLIPGAEAFNPLPAAKKLELLDRALSDLADNPALREEIVHTFDTQLGTLKDNLFGVEGILGRMGRDPFEGLLTGLEGLNSWLERNTDALVRHGNALMNPDNLLGISPEEQRRFLGPTPDVPKHWTERWGEKIFGGIADLVRDYPEHVKAAQERSLIRQSAAREYAAMLARYGEQERAGEVLRDVFSAMGDPTFQKILGDRRQAFERMKAERAFFDNLRSQGLLPDLTKPKPERREPTMQGETVNNIFESIRIDLKSDDSPEAIAVKFGKAMERASQTPRRAARAPSLRTDPRTRGRS